MLPSTCSMLHAPRVLSRPTASSCCTSFCSLSSFSFVFDTVWAFSVNGTTFKAQWVIFSTSDAWTAVVRVKRDVAAQGVFVLVFDTHDGRNGFSGVDQGWISRTSVLKI